jgi:hypothetical protein
MIEETFRTYVKQAFDTLSVDGKIIFGSQMDSFLFKVWAWVGLNEKKAKVASDITSISRN